MRIEYDGKTTLEEAEKIIVEQALEFHNQNKTQTAKALGISLKTLYNKIDRWTGAYYYSSNAKHALKVRLAESAKLNYGTSLGPATTTEEIVVWENQEILPKGNQHANQTE